jgi:hypothetical protein
MGKEKNHILLPQSVNWDLFLHLAVYHRLFPLAYKTLCSLNNPAVPAEVINALQQEYRQNALRSLCMTGEMVRIINSFEENGIQCLVLKGHPLAFKLYGDFALRPSKDIDILVEPQKLEQAEKILKEEGYINNTYDFPMTPRQKRSQINQLKHYIYFNSERNICLEIHWKIHHIDLGLPALSNLCAGKLEIAGSMVPVMADEEWLWFLMVHGCGHKWFRLRWLCDIDRFMRQSNCLDWDKIIFMANKSGLKIILHQTMILLKELFALPIPAGLKQSVLHDDKAWDLAKTVINKLVDKEDNISELQFLYLKNSILMINYNLKLYSGFSNKLAYISSLCKPIGQDYKLISLPDSLYPLYYFIRPFAWLWRRISIAKGNTL